MTAVKRAQKHKGVLMTRSYILLAALALTVAAITSSAQDANGRISGTITDTTGAVIPKAKVTITNQSTQLTWKTTGDDKGFYVVTNLPVGTYNVEASVTGFRPALQTGHELPDSGRLTANFKLELGGVSQSVTVTEVLGESVNTVSGELATTIDSEQVADLALNGRNYMELATLMPGVMVTSLDQMATTTSLSVGNQSINGNRTDTNHLAVDGGSNLDSGSNGSQINNVGVDFIQQVRIQTSAFSAEFGRNSGANINVVTKSGGNQLPRQSVRDHPQRRSRRQGLLRPGQAGAALQRLRLEPQRAARHRARPEEGPLLLHGRRRMERDPPLHQRLAADPAHPR